MKRWDGPCGDPYCHRGAQGLGFSGGSGKYRDGPCNDPFCQWVDVKSQDREKKAPVDPYKGG